MRTVESVIRLTLLVALPASVGLAVLAKPIIFLIYGQPHVAALVGPLLAVLGAAVVFICLTGPINAMLQAVGRADIPMKIILVGGLIKLGLNVLLVLQPRINIMGSAYSTLVCYMFMVTASLLSLKKATGVRLRVGRVFLRPLTAALCCGAGRLAANGLLGRVIGRQGRYGGGHRVGGAGVCGGPVFGSRFYERRYFKSAKRGKNRTNT